MIEICGNVDENDRCELLQILKKMLFIQVIVLMAFF